MTEAKERYEFLIKEGLQPVAAAGIVGNVYQESKFNSGAAATRPGAAIHQLWRVPASRLTDTRALKNVAAKQGRDWKRLAYRLRFVDWEMKNTHKGAGAALARHDAATGGRRLRPSLRAPQGRSDGDRRRIHGIGNRRGNAVRMYGQFGKTGSEMTATPGTGGATTPAPTPDGGVDVEHQHGPRFRRDSGGDSAAEGADDHGVVRQAEAGLRHTRQG